MDALLCCKQGTENVMQMLLEIYRWVQPCDGPPGPSWPQAQRVQLDSRLLSHRPKPRAVRQAVVLRLALLLFLACCAAPVPFGALLLSR
jgi:hypothetical protein